MTLSIYFRCLKKTETCAIFPHIGIHINRMVLLYSIVISSSGILHDLFPIISILVAVSHKLFIICLLFYRQDHD